VLGLAQTGTGKTAAFALPILQRLAATHRPGPRALVVAPTRELAAQVQAEFQRLARHTRLTSTAVFGGLPIERQVRALRARPDVVVACPGRLLDLLERRALTLSAVEVLVLDEADHMFDMGFLPDVRRILRALPSKRQNLMFSATMPREIRTLADSVLVDPAVIELGNSRPAETIEHALYSISEGEKGSALEVLLSGPEFRSAIVFLRTKRRAQRLAERLSVRGHAAVAMQGNMSQAQRERALKGFRDGRYDILVATDIAARGLDIAGVSHVVNFDVPNTPDAYTHRIGRTGRAELTGTAFTFVTPADAEMLRAIEKRLGGPIARRPTSELGVLERATLSGPKGGAKGRPNSGHTGGHKGGHKGGRAAGSSRAGARGGHAERRGPARRHAAPHAPARRPHSEHAQHAPAAEPAAFGLGLDGPASASRAHADGGHAPARNPRDGHTARASEGSSPARGPARQHASEGARRPERAHGRPLHGPAGDAHAPRGYRSSKPYKQGAGGSGRGAHAGHGGGKSSKGSRPHAARNR
jgi:ATP-dependent RNA helicase RhlE